MTNVIATYLNADDGIESRVAHIDSGYSVTIHDVDADEVVGIAIIFKNEADAIKKAQSIANPMNMTTQRWMNI